jgi:hypothetical protein
MGIWNDYWYQQERYNDLLRAAEQERCVQAALAARTRPAVVYNPLLAWLGKQLIAWGWRLRARYGALEHPCVALRLP